MPALNIDTVCNILEHTSLSGAPGVVRSFVPGVSETEVDCCVNGRLSPIVYLRKLTPHCSDLFVAMGAFGVVLSGSRAAEYFYPGACDNSSDWDFFCDSEVDSVIRFSNYMKKIGALWEELPADEEGSEYKNLNVLRGTLSKGGATHKIQLIWPKSQRKTALSTITSFHSSIVQCFITGFCAVSMYDSLTSKGVSLAWVTPDTIRSAIARRKYTSRGIKYLSYDTYRHAVDKKGCTDPRHFADLSSDGVFVVDLSRYYSDEVSRMLSKEALYKFKNGLRWYDEGGVCKHAGVTDIPLVSVLPGALKGDNGVIETEEESQWERGSCTSFTRKNLEEWEEAVDAAVSAILLKHPWLSQSPLVQAKIRESVSSWYRFAEGLQ